MSTQENELGVTQEPLAQLEQTHASHTVKLAKLWFGLWARSAVVS